jgi:hypothetical protein
MLAPQRVDQLVGALQLLVGSAQPQIVPRLQHPPARSSLVCSSHARIHVRT